VHLVWAAEKTTTTILLKNDFIVFQLFCFDGDDPQTRWTRYWSVTPVDHQGSLGNRQKDKDNYSRNMEEKKQIQTKRQIETRKRRNRYKCNTCQRRTDKKDDRDK